MSDVLKLLLAHSTRADADRLRCLSGDIDRLIHLTHAFLTGTPPQRELARQLSINGPLGRSHTEYRTAMHVLATYVKQSVYEVDIAQCMMSRMLYNTAEPDPSTQRECAAFVLAVLVQADMSTLLLRHLRLVALNFIAEKEGEEGGEEEQNVVAPVPMPVGDGATPAPDDVVYEVLAQAANKMPVFSDIMRTTPWARNVAAVLIYMAMTNGAYDIIRTLLTLPQFTNALSVTALDEVQRFCASAILSLRNLQQTDPSKAVVYIDDAQATRLHAFATQKVDAGAACRKMVDDLSTIEKVVRMRERLEEAEPGTGVAMLKNALPEVGVESAKAAVAIVHAQKECVEALLVSARNKLLASQVAQHGAKSGEEIPEAQQHMLLYVQQLMESTADLSAATTEPNVLHYKPPPPTDPDADVDDRVFGPEWPVKYGASVLQQMLTQGGAQPDAASVDWSTIAVIQTLYRYYAGTVVPEYERVLKHLEEARHVGAANQQAVQEAQERELQERIRNINGDSYFDD